MTQQETFEVLMPHLKETGIENFYSFGDNVRVGFYKDNYVISFLGNTVVKNYSSLKTIDFFEYANGNSLRLWDNDYTSIEMWDY